MAKVTHKEKNIKKVPNLRFPEFDGEWEERFIGEISEIKTGNNDTQNRIADGKYPFFVRSNTVEKINSYSYDGESILTSGDGVGVGKNFHYVNGKFDFHQRVYSLRNFKEGYLGKYLYHLFSEKFYERVRKLSAKNSVDSVRMDMISKMKLYFPSFVEQQKIATFLNLIADRIQTQNKIIKELNVLKTTINKRIFSGEFRFKDETGKAFPVWEKFSVGELGEFFGGGTPSSSNTDFWKGDTPWVSSSDLSENNIHSINITRFITESAINDSATKLCKGPLILIVSRVGVGKVAYSEKDLCTSQDFLNICNFSCNGLFLTYLLSIEMKKAASAVQGTSIKGISSTEIKSKQILLPCKLEQIKISDFLFSIDSKVDIENQLLQKLEKQKKFLLQQMFM